MSIDELCELLGKVGLCTYDYIDREINSSLSGGEIKRIEIASVLARKTKLTIFDEPEAGIDLWSFTGLIKVFEENTDRFDDNENVIIDSGSRWNIAENNDVFYSMKMVDFLILI